MAIFWQSDENEVWVPTDLAAAAHARDGSLRTLDPGRTGAVSGEVRFLPVNGESRATKWLLLAPAETGVLINGEAGVKRQFPRSDRRFTSHLYYACTKTSTIFHGFRTRHQPDGKGANWMR